jgi:GT2 family glycosyltransferase
MTNIHPEQLRDAFPIMVKIWAGNATHDLRYIRRSLPSLLASQLPPAATVIFINDCSSNPAVECLLKELAARYSNVEIWTNPQRLGPNRGQEYNFPRLVARFPNALYYLICDDDILYHPGWLQRLIQAYEEAKTVGLAGVFTAINLPARPALRTISLPTSQVILKERQPALNWLVPREVYRQVGPFRHTGVAYDTDYCGRLAALGLPVICLKPSYVQNIGYHGAYQNSDLYTAHDFVGKRDWYLCTRDWWYAFRRPFMGLTRLGRAVARRLLRPMSDRQSPYRPWRLPE